ncbi:hypothetical protein [Vibrio sp. CAU 1672]|uniref:hypothetical protein n=1 Tax=Vibrio sp. CAU 1672 TaxID=3032594 RepID=UPI0023DCA109|nr:hypothetical protein [Vibrio sp. CAU 1672]MDF2156202.1 hypothetical protein [Vibrio sp. CAU 1672]
MKPLGTSNAAENELTTPETAFGKAISQCGLSTKPLKPRGIYNTRENVISASKSAFVPTNSTSRVSEKSSIQVTPKSPLQRTKQPLERCQFWIFNTLVNTEVERRHNNLDFELLPLDLAI